MEKKADAPSREERLAAKLRENLKRRKAQARELGDPDNAPLPKEPPKS
jgi:predicted aminopeptidase